MGAKACQEGILAGPCRCLVSRWTGYTAAIVLIVTICYVMASYRSMSPRMAAPFDTDSKRMLRLNRRLRNTIARIELDITGGKLRYGSRVFGN